MYSIVHKGARLGFCDEPRYVKDHYGVFIQTGKDDATHVAIGGNAYDLSETLIIEVDTAEIENTLNALLEQNVNAMEDAILELAELIGGE